MADTRVIARTFLLSWALTALAVLLVVLSTEKLPLHAAINSWHAPWADVFFTYFTNLADGWVPTLIALTLLVFKDVRSFLMVGLSAGLSAIVVQSLKRLVFPEHDRPAMFRDALGTMDWVQGIEQHHYFSFPSGHSTAAFSMCLALAVVLGRPKLVVWFALFAAALAFSRVYLSQHFTEDVLAGSALGTLTAVFVHRWLYMGAFSHKAWLQRRLLPHQNQ